MAVAPPKPAPSADLDAPVRAARSRQKRRQTEIAGGVAILIGVAFAAYLIATGTSANRAFVRGPLSPAAAAACAAPVTPVVSSPSGLGNARAVGHVLWISAPYYGNGYPTPVVMGTNSATSLARVVLRGWRCSDGRLLRFWFYVHKTTEVSPQEVAREEPFPNHHGPVSSAALASTGTFTVTAWLRSMLDGSFCGSRYTHPANCVREGSLMFSSPGKWVIQAQHGNKVVGTAVFGLHG